jgi:hypothetical protein
VDVWLNYSRNAGFPAMQKGDARTRDPFDAFGAKRSWLRAQPALTTLSTPLASSRAFGTNNAADAARFERNGRHQ